MKYKEHPIHIALAEDHIMIRKGIYALISEFGGFRIDIEASNGVELIDKLNRAERLPDICILDISMPKKDGFETIKEIRGKWPDIKFLVLTMYRKEDVIIRMLRSGANGYITKNCPANELKRALISVYETNHYLSELISNTALNAIKNDRKTQCELNDKEIRFLSLCCEDKSYKEIADIMDLSSRTIEGYRDILFEKLQVNTKVGLVMYAIQTGIVTFL